MEIELDDGPSFGRQRRNVMIISLVVLAASFLKLDYSKLTLFGVTPGVGAADRLPIAFSILTWYFVWRLSQCDPPGNVMSWPRNYLHSYLQEILPLDAVKYEEDVKADYYKELKQKGARGIKVSPNPTTVRNRSDEEMQIKSMRFDGMMNMNVNSPGPVPYELRYTLFLNHESAETQRVHKLALATDSRLYRRAWARAYLLSMTRKQLFTEYYLPYLLGFTCIGYCVEYYVRTVM